MLRALVNELRSVSQIPALNSSALLSIDAHGGVESVVRTDDLSILGLVEIGSALQSFGALQALKTRAIEKKPDAVILVGLAGLNLKLARALHRTGSRLFTTSVHSFGRGAVIVRAVLSGNVDCCCRFYPLIKDWYATAAIDQVEFVGHPLAGEVTLFRIARSFAGHGNLIPGCQSFLFCPAVVARS